MDKNLIEQNLQNFFQWTKENCNGDEKSEAQKFQIKFFECFGLSSESLNFETRVKFNIQNKKSTKYADCFIPNIALVEMKSSKENLIHHYNQLFEYYFRIPAEIRPQYSILCNFKEFWIFDFNKFADIPLQKINIEDIASSSSLDALGFILGKKARFLVNIEEITRAAVDDVKELYTRLKTRQAINKLTDEEIQRFVLQCVFCFFWEDVDSSVKNFFLDILEECKKAPAFATAIINRLFKQMDNPKQSTDPLFSRVKYFNGGLFSEILEVPLAADDIDLMIKISMKDWRPVRPSIFGTIFESTMDSAERHAAGAHYTFEADIRKIVNPTIVRYWDEKIERAGKNTKELEKLLTELREYQVLDPSCGSGNFLFIAYLELKRIEQEIYAKIEEITKQHKTRLLTVSPKQFFGIDIKPFAVELAKLTLEISRQIAINQYDLHDEQPLPLQNLDENIICADALFTEWPSANAIIGNPPFLGSRKMRDSGISEDYIQKIHALYPADEFPKSADFCTYWFRKAHEQKAERIGLVGTNSISQGQSRKASLDFIIANGGIIHDAISTQEWSGEAAVHVSIVNWVKKPLSPALSPKGEREYEDDKSLSSSLSSQGEREYEDDLFEDKGNKRVLNSTDSALWVKLQSSAQEMRKTPTKAEELVWEELRAKKLGIKFRRQHPLEKFILDFFCIEAQLAIEIDGEIHDAQKEYDCFRDEYLRSIQIKTLRFTNEQVLNDLKEVIESIKTKIKTKTETPLAFRRGAGGEASQIYLDEKPVSFINSSLKCEVDITQAHRLKQNQNICFQGVKVVGDGFNITEEQALKWIKADKKNQNVIKKFASAEIVTDSSDFTPVKWVIDFNNMSLEEASLYKLPFEHVKTYVKPFRDTVRDEKSKEYWWKYGRNRPAMREAIKNLNKYIAIPNVSKWTIPAFLLSGILVSGSMWVVASDDYYLLGVLTSKLHRDWINAQKSTLEDRTAYTNTTCFETFPFLNQPLSPTLSPKGEREQNNTSYSPLSSGEGLGVR